MNSLYTRAVSGLVFPLHERLKHHDTVVVRKQLEQTQWWIPDRLAQLQLQRLRSLLQHAQQHVPYYRELFARTGFEPAAVTSLADLQRLPFLGKAEIRANPDALKADNAVGLARFNTGGSSGEPLIFFIGNLITTFLLGMLVRVSMPQLGETATAICSAKLTQAFWQTLVRAFFCGILMYLAVSTYKEKNTVLGILFCVPVFILSGFEHSIADMFYFGASGIFSLSAALFMLAVVIGNSLGGMLLPALTLIGGEKK